MLLQENPVRAHRVRLAGIPVSEVCFGTEHINRSVPEFGAGILEDAARLHGITFWDTDNAYGSQTQVAAALRRFPGSFFAPAFQIYQVFRSRRCSRRALPLGSLCLPCLSAAGGQD